MIIKKSEVSSYNDFLSRTFNRMPLLHEFYVEARRAKPYKGLKIYHNIPLTLATLAKVEVLLAAGAEITVSNVGFLPPHPATMKYLKERGVAIDLDHTQVSGHDIHLDCCAELLEFDAPRIGTLELTRTGSLRYEEAGVDYPYFSVDQCDLKRIETLGTGIGFARAFVRYTGYPISGQKFMIVGFGKVGHGVANTLLQQGAHVVAIERDASIISEYKNYKNLTLIHIDDTQLIKQHLEDTFCMVTATGCEGVVAKLFSRRELCGIYLANLGAVDEFGPKFSKNEVMFGKLPLNFFDHEPTELEYLDPIFTAHNIGVKLLLQGFKGQDLNTVFKDLVDEPLCLRWREIYQLDGPNVLWALGANQNLQTKKMFIQEQDRFSRVMMNVAA